MRSRSTYSTFSSSRAILYASRGGRTVWTFPIGEPSHRAQALVTAARALAETLLARSRKAIQIETIDGEPSASGPAGEAFARAGWRRAYRGLEIDRHTLATAEPH